MACSGKVVADIEYMKEIFCMYMPCCCGCEFPFVAKVIVDIKCIQVSLVVVVNSLQVDLSTFLLQVYSSFHGKPSTQSATLISHLLFAYLLMLLLCVNLWLCSTNTGGIHMMVLYSDERMKKVKVLFHNLCLCRSHLTLRWQEKL